MPEYCITHTKDSLIAGIRSEEKAKEMGDGLLKLVEESGAKYTSGNPSASIGVDYSGTLEELSEHFDSEKYIVEPMTYLEPIGSK